MAKATLIAARQAQALADIAKRLAEVLERLERIERTLDLPSAPAKAGGKAIK